jgi:hypothetical protein
MPKRSLKARRRQRGAERIVHQIERQSRTRAPVTERVEPLQAADRAVIDALAALLVDIVRQVARHRGDDLDLIGGEKFSEVFLARLLLDSEVMAVHHLHRHVARRGDQPAEVRIEFGRAAGNVERRNAPPFQEVDHGVGCRAIHLLGAAGAGIDVAMHAGLVAAIADIDLQGRQRSARNGGERDLVE